MDILKTKSNLRSLQRFSNDAIYQIVNAVQRFNDEIT